MKKQVLILISVVLSLFFLFIGCNNIKHNSNSLENLNVKSIETGKYFGNPYRITSSFIPVLTLDNDNTFKFELGIKNSIIGTYSIENNKLVLTSNHESESYTFKINKHTLIFEQEIYDYVKENTVFRLVEQSNK